VQEEGNKTVTEKDGEVAGENNLVETAADVIRCRRKANISETATDGRECRRKAM